MCAKVHRKQGYNLNERKLDPRTITCYLIGHQGRFKGYRSYCLNHTTRIIETGNTKFLENDRSSERIAS